MTLFQFSIGLVILAFMVARPFVYKPCVQYFPAELSVAFTSIWLLVALAITAPIFSHLFTDNAAAIITSPYLLLSVLKGGLLWLMIKLQQIINKESTSSSVFFGFIALALGSLVNNIFFKEGLLLVHLICICGLGILGLFFVLRGDARRLSVKGKIYFALIVLFGATFSVTDHLAIPQIGWYSHLLFSTVVMFLVCLWHGISKTDYLNIFKNKQVVLAGVIYAVSEFLIIYTSINILPVSFVAVFMRIAAPVVMIVSALKYNEQSWKNQLVFGAIAMALVLPLIFIK